MPHQRAARVSRHALAEAAEQRGSGRLSALPLMSHSAMSIAANASVNMPPGPMLPAERAQLAGHRLDAQRVLPIRIAASCSTMLVSDAITGPP